MPRSIKKLNNYNKPFWRFILSPKRIIFLVIAAVVFTGFTAIELQKNVFAATGINRTINFQGKVVNRDGTNVADGQYTFVFKLYDASSGGANPWTETQNNVQVTAGIFRVSLGSVTTFASAGVDFNTDNLYLGINFNSDGEMTPRVRFAAVPYAINAETVAGLTVTNTTGTLTIPNSKTVQFGGAFTTDANDISFTTSGGTTLALPTSGTLATLGGVENLSNKTFTSSITVSGVTTDLTTGTNESLTITPNGTGNVLINPSAGGQAALVVNKTGSGDIFSASSAGITKFTIKSDGTASSSAGFTIDGAGSLQTTKAQTLTVGNGGTGNIVIDTASGNSINIGSTSNSITLGHITTATTNISGGNINLNGNTAVSSGNTLSVVAGQTVITNANSGGLTTLRVNNHTSGGSIAVFQNAATDVFSILNGGSVTATNNFTLSGTMTGGKASLIANQNSVGFDLFAASASGTTMFVIKNDGTASSSAGFTVDGAGSIQSTKNQSLTIGGGTTGELTIGRTSQKVWLPGFDCSGSGNGGKLTTTSGGVLTCAADTSGAGGGDNFWQYNSTTGIIAPGNLTTDLLIGSTATTSANFAFLNNAGGTPTATVAGNLIIMPKTSGIQEMGGFLGINKTNPLYNIDTNVSNGKRGLNVLGTTSTASDSFYGAYNTLSYTGGSGNPGVIAGTRNDLSITAAGGSNSRIYGTYNSLTIGADSNNGYGSYNVFDSGSFSSNMYGYFNDFGTNTALNQNAYGLYNLASPGGSSNSTKTGVYNKFDNILNSFGFRNVFTGDQTSVTLKGLINDFTNSAAVNGLAFTGVENNLSSTRGGTYYGVVNTISSSDAAASTQGIRNVLSLASGGSGGTVTGVYNVLTNNGGGSSQLSYGVYTKLITKGTSTPTSYGTYVFDDTGSTNGTNIGFYSNLSHATNNFALYIEDSSAASYFGNNAIKWGTGGTADVTLTRGIASQLSLTGTALFTGGNTGGIAEFILNQTGNSTNDIFAASSSGVTKFVIKNDGTASTSGNLVLNSAGSLQTTKNQTLSLGGDSTGDIIIKPRNGSGFVGINTSSPSYPLDLLSTTNPQVRFGYDASNYMTLQIGSTGITTFDAIGSGAAFNFKDAVSLGIASSTNGLLQFNNSAGGTAASITTNASGDLLLQSSSGIVNLGIGSGDITIDPGTNNIVANLTSGNFLGQKNGVSLIKLSTVGTVPIASFSGTTSFAGLLVDNSGVGDLITASTAGLTRFTVTNNGTASSSAGFTIDGNGGVIQSTRNQSLTVGGGTTGELTIGKASQRVFLPGFDCSGNGNGGKLTTTAGGVLTCSDDTSGGGGGGGTWTLNSVLGYNTPINNTADLLVGGTSTQSAMFSVLGLAAGTNPSASVSATTGTNNGNGIAISGDGSIQSFRNNTLTLGGNTTGDIKLLPRNGSGFVGINNASPAYPLDLLSTTNPQVRFGYDTSNYMTLAIGSSGVTTFDAVGSGALFNFKDNVGIGIHGSSNGILTLYSSGSVTDPSISTDSSGNLILSAPSGNVQLGATSGNIAMSLVNTSDQFIADKTVILSGGISTNDFVFKRVLTGGSNNQAGAILSVSDLSGGSGSITTDLFLINAALTSGNFQGSLARFQQDGRDSLRIYGNGTSPVATISANTSFAALVVDNIGVGDILTASTGGVTKFSIKNNGQIYSSGYVSNGGILFANTNGVLSQTTVGNNGQCLLSVGGGTPTWGSCGGGAAGTWTLDSATGTHTPINNTADLLVGGTSTQSAMFSVLGIAAGTNPSASVSAINGANANKGIYMSGDGSLQSVRNNFLTLGGNTTGDIYLKPLNGSGMVRIIHGTTGTGGLMLGDSETDATQKAARLKSIPYNSATSLPISMLIAINSSTNNVLNIGGGSGSEYAVTDVYIKTAANQTTTIGTTRFYVGGASGFVGIGDSNTSPVARLDIVDDATDINGEKLVLRRTGAGDVGMSFQQNGISAFGIVNRSGVGSGLAFVDNYYEGSNGTEIARFYASAGVGIGTLGNTPTATLDVRGAFTDSGTLPFGRFTGTTSFAGLAINNSGVGELFTASSSGTTRFTISNTGAIGLNGSYGALGQCLLSNGVGSGASWGGCAAGAAGGWFNLISSQGTIVPVNQTLDLLWGGNSTASAGFRIAGATKNYGTVAAASVSANTSFAGFVIDNRGSGELLTASSSGATRFTIYNSGNVVIGSGPDSGFKLDVKGSVRIGNNTATDDIVKDSSTDFTQSGYSITTNDSVNTVSTSENQIKLVTDLIGAGASLTAPAADQTTGTNVTTGSVAFQRPDKKFVVFVGGAATSRIYDSTTGTWIAGPSTAGAVSMGAGARVFQRQNGSFLVIHGGAASSTTVYSPGGSANLGTTIAGPTTTAAVGAGSQIIRRPDGKILVIHGNTSTTSSVHDPVTATGTTSLIGTFNTGPATTGNVVAGSFVFQKPDGKWILGLGGGTTTNLYDPSFSGVGGGGAFSAGPSLSAGAPAAGTHVVQLPDGRFMVLVGGSTATQIYDWKSNSFSAGSTMTVTIGAGAHSFQRSDGKWVVVAGGNSTSLMLYDPTSGANGTFSNLASGLSATAGVGALTFQRPDGKYIVVHGNGVQTTTLYDAGWNTTGTWTSEDILNTKISTYSAMIWSANPQSANNNARLDSETINIAVKTGDTLISLGNNPYRTLQDSGDLIKAYGNSQYAKIQVTFTVPIRSYPGGSTAYVSQTNIWDGEGGTFLRRNFIQPTVFSMRIQNPLVSYGDPSGQGDPAFGRNFATASAQLEGVGTDNSNRLTLLTLRNQPTSTASAGIIIASASANLGGNAGAGAHTIERNNGQFITILGGGATTTRTYDSDTNTWSAGPDLPNAAGAGAHSFLLPDGRFFVVLGNTTNKTAIFDPQTSLFLAGPNLFGNVGIGANSFQRPDGYFVILNGGATSATNILDPFTMTVTQGPFTAGATPNVGGGALNIKRPDGRILVVLGNGNAIATGTNVYDPASNSFAAGPALVGGTVNTGGNALQLNTGRILLFKAAATSNWYDPIQNTFAVGPTPTANGAGSFVIPRSDGKIFKANGGNAATTNIIDPQSGVAVTATSAPTLPCNVNTGGHVFQRPTGEYVAICGGSTANTVIIDAGWNLGGTYTTEQIQVPNLSSTSSIFWKNIGQGNITVKYRTASSQQALGVASWKDAMTSGSYLSPSAGDTWLQARFDLQGYLQDLPGAKTRVWNGSDAGGNMVYYRPIQTPILEYWKVMNIQDPTLLTLSSGGSNAFRFSSDGQAYTSDNGAWNSGGADLAERYQSQDTLEAGEVVSLDRFHPQNTKRSTLAYDQNAMGVVSTQPGFVAGAYTENAYPIALVGRVPVKVSTENGQIHAGDYLTSASIPGYAMKATVAGRVIGQAMEDFTPDQVQDCPKFGAGSLTATQCGTITVFVNLTSYNGESVNVAMKDAGYALKEEELPAISGIDFSEGTDARRQQEVLGFLKTQKDNGQSIYTDRVAATQEIISPQIVTDLLIAKKIKAESIEGLEIITNSIEELSDRVASGSAVQNFSDKLNALSLNQKDFENQMASLSAKLDKMGAMNILSFIANGSESGDLTMVNNFASYGTTTLSEVSVINSMTIGSGSTLTLSNNSINTLGDELAIQPLRQSAVSFLDGLIRFDTDGKATFSEDVTFAKNVGVSGVLSARTVSSTELQLGQGTTTIVSDTEVTATAAAGLVVLKRNTDHVKVNNPLVKDNSFIFITPKTKTQQQLFLLDQTENSSFTVGVDGKSTEDIKFNYLIVN